MDESPEYVKRCRKAVKIQELKPEEYGDFYATQDGETGVYGTEDTYVSNFWGELMLIWLPRQDELQEMVKGVSVYGLIHRMNHFVYGEDGETDFNDHSCISMEQLWLAFVMKAKYQKVWDSNQNDWVVEGK